jgi:hypothetical protein
MRTQTDIEIKGKPGLLWGNLTHIPHPKLSQREITEMKNQSEHKNKHEA